MNVRKTTIFFWMSLALCFGYYAIKGKHGIKKYRKISREIAANQQKIMALNQEISMIESNIHNFTHRSFEKEMVLRTDLHMGYTNEIVYLYPKKCA